MARGLAENGAKVYIGGRRKEVVDKAAAGFTPSKGSPNGSISSYVLYP